MGFGAIGKWIREAGKKVGNWLNGAAKTVGGAVQKVIGVAKPFVGVATDALSAFNPGLGQAVKTGFNLADGISAGASRGGIKGGIEGGMGSILNRGRTEPPEIWQDEDED
jgi:hypothetical protein